MLCFARNPIHWWAVGPDRRKRRRRPVALHLSAGRRSAFTLIELLIVIAIVGLLAALLLPALAGARAASEQAKCAGHLRQLHTANTLYAAEHGTYVAAAEDICEGANRKRWHGQRASMGEAFDGAKSPLASYIGNTEALRACPAFVRSADGFELGCGGYGYNDRGVGSQSYLHGYNARGVALGMPPGAIRQPAQTVMFADAAFVQSSGGVRRHIEYSFAEAYYHLREDQPEPTYRADPSIHFRHRGRANVVWCDGHVSAERMTHSTRAGRAAGLGWFGPADNTLFDPF